ncbi:hypothetical protein PENTCL1PPCAC_10286, partial [Pristionchus entomophagus]
SDEPQSSAQRMQLTPDSSRFSKIICGSSRSISLIVSTSLLAIAFVHRLQLSSGGGVSREGGASLSTSDKTSSSVLPTSSDTFRILRTATAASSSSEKAEKSIFSYVESSSELSSDRETS